MYKNISESNKLTRFLWQHVINMWCKFKIFVDYDAKIYSPSSYVDVTLNTKQTTDYFFLYFRQLWHVNLATKCIL